MRAQPSRKVRIWSARYSDRRGVGGLRHTRRVAVAGSVARSQCALTRPVAPGDQGTIRACVLDWLACCVSSSLLSALARWPRRASLAEAAIPIPVTITYQGVYEYHETAISDGTVISYSNQRIAWGWRASGSVPISFNGSTQYGVANLPGHLTVLGVSSDTGAYGPPQSCTYSAGSSASAPIHISLLDDREFQAEYGVVIPERSPACRRASQQHPIRRLGLRLQLL